MMGGRKRQDGVSLTLFAVVILLGVVVFVVAILFSRKANEGTRSNDTRAHFTTARNALVSFASQNQRLPCPADPSLDTGDASPAGASAACNFAAGTLPWKTLGIRRDDAYDAWGWKISYRVYTGVAGNVGSLTQASGASAVNCDTVEPWSAGTTAIGTCRTNHDTLPADYYTGKGFSVNDFGTVHAASAAGDGAAFVLVSHGASGLGAYTAAGTRTAMPVSVDELANTSAAGPFVAKAANVRDLSPDNAAYFDDLLAYATLADLVTSGNVAARDWPEPPAAFASVRLDTASLTTALERTPPYGDLGQATINFTSARVSGFSSGGTQNLDFETVGGVEGLGGIAGGNGSLNSANGEGVRVDLTQTTRRMALALNDFTTGTYSFFGFPIAYSEQVRLDFYAGSTLQTSVTKQACRATGVATFENIDVGGGNLFDRVDITSINGSFPLASSSFFVSEFKTCAAGATCQTSLQNAGNLCP